MLVRNNSVVQRVPGDGTKGGNHMNRQSATRMRVLVLAITVAVLGAACTTGPNGGGPSGNIPIGADCTANPIVVAGARLSGCNLGALNLAGLDLAGIDLRGAYLAGADFTGTNLTNANLSSANLTGANLTGANLTEADLSGAILFGALLVGAILFHTIFGDAPVPRVYAGNGSGGGAQAPGDGVGAGSQAFISRGEPWCDPNTNSNLVASGHRSVRTDADTDFTGAHFTDNEFRGLDFRTGNFTDAVLDNLNSPWWGCLSMAGGTFDGTTFVRWAQQNMDMTGADFSSSIWIHPYLCQADMSGADLHDAQFIGAANIDSCADYSEAGWPYLPRYGVSFNGANLQGARFGGNYALAGQYSSGQVGTGPWNLAFRYSTYDPDTQTSTLSSGADFRNADLTGAIFEEVDLSFADFNGAITTNVTSTAPMWGNNWQQTDFGTGGWAGSTWTGQQNFDGAACPDGSTGSYANPCFVTTP